MCCRCMAVGSKEVIDCSVVVFRHRDGDTVHYGVEDSLFFGNMLRDVLIDGISFVLCLGNGYSESGELAWLDSRVGLNGGDLRV